MSKTRMAVISGLFAALTLFALTASAQQAAPSPAPQGGPEAVGKVEPAEGGMAPKAIEDKPAPTAADRETPVAVSHQGQDALGARLAFRLKEIFNSASLFTLTDQDERKIKVLLSTREEFPGRANLGSIYSATWIYQASENVLTHYLAGEVGFIPADDPGALAEALAARTEEIATRYAYLFE